MEAARELDQDWHRLSPGEQERIVQSVVQQVEVHPDRAEVRFNAEQLASLLAERSQPSGMQEMAT
jgi:hypothetical protein